MVLPRLRFMERLLDAYYFRQIRALTEWLMRHSLEKEGLFIDLPRQKRFIHSGPISFIFCAPDGLLSSLKKNDKDDICAWHAIFLSTEYEIWENKERYAKSVLPLRFGLTEEEKSFALAHVRRVLGEYLKTGKRDKGLVENVPVRFREEASADVALWARGILRGSCIAESLPLIDALEVSAIRSCRDRRFKPLTAEELDSTIIEIAIFSDLRMPLLRREIAGSAINTANGYVVLAGGAKGWALPAIFNGVTFRGMRGFLRYLLEEKAHVSANLLSEAYIETFAVDNFVEPIQSPKGALSLNTVAARGADFLCRIQEADGNIPPIIDPLTGRRSQVDWARLAFTSWALALFGSINNSPKYSNAARKSFSYLISNLYTHPSIAEADRCTAFIHTYRLARVLGEHEEMEKIHDAIRELMPRLSYESILYSQIVLHLLESGNELAKAEEFSNAILKDYEQRVSDGDSIELVRFAELIPKSEAIREWYVSQQLSDGSFPKTFGSRPAHTRGTGKIFEVLCLEPEKNRTYIERAVNWLSEMQYDENNTYFVEENVREEIIGGFRHDYLNQSVWIDAVGHVLLGAVRLADGKEG